MVSKNEKTSVSRPRNATSVKQKPKKATPPPSPKKTVPKKPTPKKIMPKSITKPKKNTPPPRPKQPPPSRSPSPRSRLPVTNPKQRKLKSILVRNPRKNRKKKSVKFAPRAKVRTFIQNDEEIGCILNPGPQNTLHQCHLAHERITNIINENSIHKVLRSNEVDNPVKVYDTGTAWWRDKSPIILYSKLRDRNFLNKFLILFDQQVRRNQNVGQIKPLIINNNRFKIRFPRVIRVK